MKLSRNSWHYKLNQWIGWSINENNLCPYFWKTIIGLLCLLPIACGKLVDAFYKRAKPHWVKFREDHFGHPSTYRYLTATPRGVSVVRWVVANQALRDNTVAMWQFRQMLDLCGWDTTLPGSYFRLEETLAYIHLHSLALYPDVNENDLSPLDVLDQGEGKSMKHDNLRDAIAHFAWFIIKIIMLVMFLLTALQFILGSTLLQAMLIGGYATMFVTAVIAGVLLIFLFAALCIFLWGTGGPMLNAWYQEHCPMIEWDDHISAASHSNEE